MARARARVRPSARDRLTDLAITARDVTTAGRFVKARKKKCAAKGGITHGCTNDDVTAIVRQWMSIMKKSEPRPRRAICAKLHLDED